MKKIIIVLCLFCCICRFNALAQDTNNGESQFTNLFEYGAPLISSEINFKNLFHNFPRFVKNATEVDLLFYKYVDVVKSRKQVRNFVKKNIYNVPSWGTSMTVYENAGRQQTDIRLDISATVGSDRSELNEIIKTISEEYVQIGYEIYMIKFVYRLKTYEYYVFVNSETKQVVTKGNIFGFSFPVLNQSD